VALDALGNVYIADTFDSSIKEWTKGSGSVSNVVPSGLTFPNDVAVDSAGMSILPTPSTARLRSGRQAAPIWSTWHLLVWTFPKPWPWISLEMYISPTPATGAEGVYGVQQQRDYHGFFGSGLSIWSRGGRRGNVYVADAAKLTIAKWTAANSAATTLVSSGLNQPFGVAVDAAGNVYIADAGDNTIKELPCAFVDPTGKSEGRPPGMIRCQRSCPTR